MDSACVSANLNTFMLPRKRPLSLLFRATSAQLFGDDVLEGGGEAKKRNDTVIAVTDCEFAVLDAPDYSDVRDRGLSQMTLDDKCHFLK